MLRFAFVFFAAFLSVLPVQADPIDRALIDAVRAVRAADGALEGARFGVDTRAYREALELRQFTSAHWGQSAELILFAQGDDAGLCQRFAAFVTTPPQNGAVTLTLCPQFSKQGSDSLRRLTILHELVHVVAGPDECRAMAFAAHVEYLASGSFTPVDAYWRANKCQNSNFKLPR